MESLLDPRLCGFLADLVVLVRRTLHVVHRRFLRTAQARDKHLRKPNLLRPRNTLGLVFSEFIDAEMRTDARDTGIAENFLQLCSRIFSQSAKSILGISIRRTQLDALKACRSELFDRSRKILRNRLPHRPSLTTDRQPKRISAKFERVRRNKSSSSRTKRGGLYEISS